ncbi:MAG: hypothetical protein KDD40_03305 [Bdellovibrionales bacterium]|nr:hypothetical protein [Bdellovibrionales bacterium]
MSLSAQASEIQWIYDSAQTSDGFYFYGKKNENFSTLPLAIFQDIQNEKLEGLLTELKDLFAIPPEKSLNIHLYFEDFISPSFFPEIEEYRVNDTYNDHLGWTDYDVAKANKSFLAWTYNLEATQNKFVIQLAHAAFYGSETTAPEITNSSRGTPLRTGYGYFRLVHEIMHAVLYAKGYGDSEESLSKSHHCLFFKDNAYDNFLQVFVNRGLISDFIKHSVLDLHKKQYFYSCNKGSDDFKLSL